jgi:hypothetical protein
MAPNGFLIVVGSQKQILPTLGIRRRLLISLAKTGSSSPIPLYL